MSRVISFGETHGKIPFSHWTEERKPGKNGKMKLLTFFFFFSLALFCTPYLLLMQSPNAPRLTPRVIKEGAKKKEERKRSWHHDGLFLLASKWQKSNVAESPSSRKFLFFFLLFLFLFFFFFFFLFSLGLILPIVRFWYEHMVPAALRMDQGHFGQELSKWRIQGNFSPRGVVQVCQTKTSPEGKPRTTSSQYHLQADIRRIGAERYWTDIKGPVLTHGELDRNLDVATIVFSEEYKQLIAILGKRTLNLNEDKFLALYNAHRGVKGGIQVILLSEFFLSFIYFVRFVARMRRGSSTAK